MKRPRRWWTVFVVGAAALVAALVWSSAVVLRLERSDAQAVATENHQESLRLALWRMDSWLGPLLAREAARPAVDYEPYRPRNAFDRERRPLEPGAVLTASPLRDFQPDAVLLHFQWTEANGLTSPQPRDETLARLRDALDVPHALRAAEGARTRAAADAPPPSPDAPRSLTELARREASTERCLAGPTGIGAARAGPLAPLWLTPADGAPALVFVRQARADNRVWLQGFLVDWPRIDAQLRSAVADLFPTAQLAPRRGPAPESGRLAAIPVTLAAPAPTAVSVGWTTTRAQLAFVWLAALVALGAVGTTLRSSIDLGERRGRFVSAVTHELRTPLTTFRMYAQMLADGMVADPARQAVYLRTLEAESERLSALVANVLAYAQLEGRARPERRTPTTGRALLDRVTPPLARRAEQTAVPLATTHHGDLGTARLLDAETVEQILFILVDNACKYAATDAGVTIDFELGDPLRVEVRDHGPGIPPDRARAVFEPFERGGRDAADPVPGVGLGLALARDLARALGGDLELMEPRADDPGARFRLTVPATEVS